MRIKDEIFCFAHLRWCHNGWASNILIMVDTLYASIHHSKYWMPIQYDTIEDGQNKKSHLLFSKYCDLPPKGVLGAARCDSVKRVHFSKICVQLGTKDVQLKCWRAL